MAENHTKFLLELLTQINREVVSALDLRTVLQRLLYAALENVGGERGSIVVLDENGKPLDATIIYGKSLHEHTAQQLKETVDRGLAGWVIRHRKAALIQDTSADERWLQRSDDTRPRGGAKSALCVPLLAREQLVGVLTLVHPVPHAYGREHLELMQAIADQASIAVLNARLYAESLRQARIMTALADSAAAFSASLQVREVGQRVLDQTLQALQVETAALGLLEGAEPSLVFHAAAGRNADNIIGQRFLPGEGRVGQVIREGRGLIIPDAEADEHYLAAERLTGIEARAIAIAPVQSQGKTIGVLAAINPISGAFDADALTVMTGLGGLAGTTIRNAQLFEQLQKAHQRYRELFEESIDPIFISDWKGRILEANREAIHLSGFGSEELHHMSLDQLHEVNWNKLGMEFERLRDEKECTYESTLQRADGSKVPVEVHARRVEFQDVDSIRWILRDIRARKELDSLRDDLTSMIYHDLRSPLANIISALELLSSRVEEDETARSILNIAAHSTERIQRLINSLLDLSRLEAGHAIETLQSVAPQVLIEAARREVLPTATNRHQTIETRLADALPCVWVDAEMIRRVLINLLENAIKFSPMDARIEVGARQQEQDVLFWVKDSGPGIPPAEHERIFEKFARLKGKGRPGGLGIGLAFCRTAVRAHGGEIWVESEEGKGAKFIFKLPAVNSK